MNELPPNPILEFNPNQMEKVRETFNYGDINRLHQDIRMFEDWIKMQHHFLVKEYDKEYLDRFLINSKGSIERAKKLFDRMSTLRGLMPEHLQGFDIENEFRNFLHVFDVCLLPKPTAENHRVLYFNIANPDTALFEHIDIARFMMVAFQYLICHDYNTGVELVYDTRNISLGMISKLSPIMVANTLMIMTEAIGFRMRGMHLISGSKVIDALVGILKQGMSKKLQSRLHVHDNVESLFKLIPKDLLPKDIGGNQDTSNKISEKTFKELSSPAFIKKMKFLESAATDETKRLCSKFNEEYSGMPGSFKVLTVD